VVRYLDGVPRGPRSWRRNSAGRSAGSLADEPEAEGSPGSTLAKDGIGIWSVVNALPAVVEFKLPEWMLDPSAGAPLPVVFDINYRPYNTAVLLQCIIVHGLEMLWGQGAGQFELWTGRTAPRDVMRSVVLEDLLPAAGGVSRGMI
ncbi:hypothetical protein ACHAWF_003029, partial [Thalassiosira exigua]